MRRRRFILMVATLWMAALAAILLVTRGSTHWWTSVASRPVIGQPFHLAAARTGGFVDSRDLVGKPYGVFFGFTHCPEVCPTTLFEMSTAFGELKDEAKDFRLFFITVDPERDKPEILKDYLSNFDARIEGLVPTLDELPDLARSFRVVYEKVPSSDGGYTMNHTALVFLFDKQGEFKSSISFGEDPDVRLKKLRLIIIE